MDAELIGCSGSAGSALKPLSTCGAVKRRSGKTLFKVAVTGQQSDSCDGDTLSVVAVRRVPSSSALWLEQIHKQAANSHTKHNGSPAAINRRNKVRGQNIPLNIPD
jgi:hypothetical protein